MIQRSGRQGTTFKQSIIESYECHDEYIDSHVQYSTMEKNFQVLKYRHSQSQTSLMILYS